jgi:transcription initiation factor TFIID TATA-box-binding protein
MQFNSVRGACASLRLVASETLTVRASITIENTVASATLKQNIDLRSVVKAFPNVEYRPERFPGLVFRLKQPKTATLIFGSGKMVCTGARSEKQAKQAVRKVVKELKNHGIIIMKRPIINVVNIVASVNLGGRIDLERTTYMLDRTMFEPEQFPGLIYRMIEPKVVFLLFTSGKCVCTGARSEEDVYTSVIKVRDQLEHDALIVYE